MNLTIASIAVLLVLSFGSIAKPAENSKAASIDFLADIPSLKNVSLRISESEFLEILKVHKLKYDHETKGDKTTYYVHATKGATVYFGFENALCTGIQRMRAD